MPSPKLPSLPKRLPDSHKGDFGTALIVGGSLGMAGAPGLSAMAALRSGAGLVKVAVPDVCQATVAALEPSYMTIALASDGQGRVAESAAEALLAAASAATAVGCGPGLGRSEGITRLVAELYRTLERPMVIDADALNALAERRDALAEHAGPRILTPHPGEFARLLNVKRIAADERSERATEFAARSGAVVVLKGYKTVINDGRQSALNETGNPGMATGGTGDVLTGIITALLCQKLAPYDAARLGAHVHGLAGDLAASQLGEIGMIASDLLMSLPHAFLLVGGDAQS